MSMAKRRFEKWQEQEEIKRAIEERRKKPVEGVK